MRIAPYLVCGSEAEQSSTPRCRLLVALGVGQRRRVVAPEPSGRVGLWLFRHNYLHRRTRRPDGSIGLKLV